MNLRMGSKSPAHHDAPNILIHAWGVGCYLEVWRPWPAWAWSCKAWLTAKMMWGCDVLLVMMVVVTMTVIRLKVKMRWWWWRWGRFVYHDNWIILGQQKVLQTAKYNPLLQMTIKLSLSGLFRQLPAEQLCPESSNVKCLFLLQTQRCRGQQYNPPLPKMII